MNRCEILIQKVEHAKIMLSEEILRPTQKFGGKSAHQLQTVGDELRRIAKDKNYTPIFPKFITDSWDYNDPLGITLMDIATILSKEK